MKIQENFSLKDYNTFGVDTYADYFVDLITEVDVNTIREFPSDRKLILGGGSNVLFLGDFAGLVVRNSLTGIKVVSENTDSVSLEVAAGESWHDFVTYCVDHEYYGIENLALIPGTVGAAPIQNIGAYGVEVKDVIEYVNYVDVKSGEFVRLSNAECNFDYRSSVFKQKQGQIIITSVSFKLGKVKKLNLEYKDLAQRFGSGVVKDIGIRDIFSAVIEIRHSKLPDPKQMGNAGSFFKNPVISSELFQELQSKFAEIPNYPLAASPEVKLPAAWLIDQAGWKGKKKGNVGVHQNHALVLVNYGGGTGEEVWHLGQEIIEDVEHKFGIKLEPEVTIV